MKANVFVRPSEEVLIDIHPEATSTLSESMLAKWQGILDLLARTAKIPAALLMKVHEEEIEVFASSNNSENVYRQGARERLGCGLYCETVVARQKPLLVPNALADPVWADNPDVPLGMISYYGLPVTWPDGSIFGTLCILDRKENGFDGDIRDLVAILRENIQSDLSLQVTQARLAEADRVHLEFLEGSRAVFESETFETAARRVFEACSRVTGAVSGYVALLSSDGERNEVLFLESGGLPCDVDPSLPMPLRGLRAEAYRRGEAVYENNFMESEHVAFLPESHVSLENVLFAPFMINGQAEGLMGLANKPGGFTPEDARLATEFANMAAIALRRNRDAALMETRLKTIREINRMTAGAVTAQELIERFIDTMEASPPVEFAWLILVDSTGAFDRETGLALAGKTFTEEAFLKEGKLPPCVERMRESGLDEIVVENPDNETGRGFSPIETCRICYRLNHQDDSTLGYFGLSFRTRGTPLDEEKRIYREIANDLSLGLHGIEVKRQKEETMDALREAKIAAEEANIAKSDFIAVMSHELRTPLNPVIGLSDLLMGQSQEPETVQCVEIINSSARHQLSLINDILDFCRIDKAEFKVEKQPTDLPGLLQNVRDLLKGKVDRQRTRINLVMAEDTPRELVTDPVRLKQILMNLVGNAAKFTEEGFITLSCSIDGEHCRIDVEDTGVGISEVDREKIFEPFAQVESAETRKYGGSGLGLAISRKLAALLGGELTLSSKPGQGSCFTLRLPLRDGDGKASESGREAGLSGQAHPEKRSVLIVEDDPSSAKTLFYLLKRYDFDLTVVHDGTSAIEACEERDFDIILLDIQLPDINGKTVCRKIRENKGSQPVIIAQTALVLHHEREHCLEAGVDAFIEKPIFSEVLFSSIGDALARLSFGTDQPE